MMKTISLFAVAAIGVAMAAPAWAATDAECQDMWKKADANADGTLSDRELIRYVALMRVGDRKIAAEGTITQAEFMDACKADVYAPRKAEEGAPLKGANSFTEGQAKDRAIGHGGWTPSSASRRTMTGSGAAPARRPARPSKSPSTTRATSSPRRSSNPLEGHDMTTVCRVYDSYAQARAAVDAVERAGVPAADVSIVANKYVSAEHADVDEVSGATKGAGIGGALGGGAGLLAGLGLLAIPGLGPWWPRAGWPRPPSVSPPAPRPAGSSARWSMPASTATMPTSTPRRFGAAAPW